MPRKPPSTFHVGRVRVRVRRGPRPDGAWYWRADQADGSGGRAEVWTGWATRDEAERLVMDVLRREDPTAPSGGEIRTVGDLLDCWLAAQQDRHDIGEATKLFSAGAAQRLVDSDIRRVQVDRLDRAALERHRDAELRRGAGAATVRRDLKVLRQAWRWAREIGQIPARDLPTVRVQREATVYTRYTPTRAEVAQVLGALDGWCRLAVILLSSTGARIGEVASLTWGRVGPDCRTVELRGKTGPRTIPLHATVARELAAWRAGSADVRADDTVLGVAPSSAAEHVRRRLRALSAELGLGGRVSPNGLRRHVTDVLYDSGQGVDVEAALLGHSPATALATYRRIREARLSEAVVAAGLGVAGEGDVIELDEERAKRGR